MRGKKVDTEFVSNFITECAKNNKMSPEEICNEARTKINKIDIRIKEVDELKKTRSKLQDVIIMLDKSSPDKSKDKEMLGYYGISNLPLANKICLYIKSSKALDIQGISSIDAPIVKQLLPLNIIKREDNKIIPNEKFQDFLDFYNKTYK